MSKLEDKGRQHHLRVTGHALETADKHTADEELTLFGACFCPFVQRAWSAIEFLQIPYKFLEVDPYSKPAELIEVSPKGLIPALRIKNEGNPLGMSESMIILEYLEVLGKETSGRSLLPPTSDPYAVALVRLQCDHVTRTLVPAFYKFLQTQDPAAQAERAKEYTAAIEGLIKLQERAEKETKLHAMGSGLWREGGEINLLDVTVGPWLLRTSIVLAYYRDYEMPSDPKFRTWIQRLFGHPAFKSTCSTDELYVDSYEKYAFNRSTSQVAKAINAGASTV